MSKLREDFRKFRKHAVLAGTLLAVVCHLLPPQYRAVCDAVAQLCSPGR